jgi:hypothetical protein
MENNMNTEVLANTNNAAEVPNFKMQDVITLTARLAQLLLRKLICWAI